MHPALYSTFFEKEKVWHLSQFLALKVTISYCEGISLFLV